MTALTRKSVTPSRLTALRTLILQRVFHDIILVTLLIASAECGHFFETYQNIPCQKIGYNLLREPHGTRDWTRSDQARWSGGNKFQLVDSLCDCSVFFSTDSHKRLSVNKLEFSWCHYRPYFDLWRSYSSDVGSFFKLLEIGMLTTPTYEMIIFLFRYVCTGLRFVLFPCFYSTRFSSEPMHFWKWSKLTKLIIKPSQNIFAWVTYAFWLIFENDQNWQNC